MVSTRHADWAATLFHEGEWSWDLQGQFVLLSKPDAPPPDIDRSKLLSIYYDDGDWAEHLPDLRAMGVVGVLRPGVDGDVFGVLFLASDFKEALLQALERQAQRAGYTWLQLSEDEFTEALSRPVAIPGGVHG